jgi:hypothetical protein
MVVPLVKTDELGLYCIEDGAASLTNIVILVIALPPLFNPVTEYVVTEDTEIGVPEIVPLAELIIKPDGSAGEIDHCVTVPPLFDGVTAFIAVPLLSEKKLGLYVIDEGATSFTCIVTIAVSLPPLFVAVMVYAVEAETTLDVPLISPVELSNVRPAGSVGVIPQVSTGPPVEVGVIDEGIAKPICRVTELVLYEITGVASLTSIVTIVVTLPPELVAVTVYAADDVMVSGVPEIAPEDVENESPDGSAGEISQSVTVPPL